jgi:hypothetical protein
VDIGAAEGCERDKKATPTVSAVSNETDIRPLHLQHHGVVTEPCESAERSVALAIPVLGGEMFGIIGAVLIVLWLLGFFAIHITAGFVHILLLTGIVLLVWHFLIGREAVAF